jgi:hypothetical protein
MLQVKNSRKYEHYIVLLYWRKIEIERTCHLAW